MTLLIPSGYAEIAIEHRGDGDPNPWYVTFGVDMNAETQTPVETVKDIVDAYQDTIGSQIWNGVSITGAQVALGTDDEEPLRFFANSRGALTGSLSGTFLPQNCALLVRKNTGVGGRRNQGRFFIPSIVNEGACNNVGQIEANSVNTYQGVCDDFLGIINASAQGLQMVILHNDPPGGLGPTPVSSLSVSNVISTQRRRLR